ncbi:DNA polymerase alpha accessory factor Mcl1 [Coemansia aciculifera]|nr:DNA polymerase alpha accessory factor Mcl1 [Coemansia aciculifera]
MLRVLHRYWMANNASWIPVLDSRKLSRDRGKREGFWPVAISAKQFIVVACRGKSKYPPFPKPILDELDIDVPLLNADTQVGQQEAKYFASRLFIEQQRGEAERTGSEYPGGASMLARDELEQDKLLLRLIQLACKSDKTQRAMDLATMIGLEQSFDAAVKIAVFLKQSSLAERLMRLRETKFASQDVEDEGDMSDGSHSETDAKQHNLPHRSRRQAAAATYGRARRAADINDDGLSGSDCDLGVEALELGKVARPPLPEEALTRNNKISLVSRPAQPPTTSKPFNPFGVALPSKSMEIKRSDSFFDAADKHSDEVVARASTSALPTAAKRQSPPGDDDTANGVPRKQAKKSTKLTAFAFKKTTAANDAKDGDQSDS